jgi:hypothetical protein
MSMSSTCGEKRKDPLSSLRSEPRAPQNNALKLTKRGILWVGALRAPSSLSRASQLSAVLSGPGEV